MTALRRCLARMGNLPAFVDSFAFRILLLIIAAGLFYVAIYPEAFAEWVMLGSAWGHATHEVALAFAIAILTALLLMVLVDRPIKKALERDVFRAVMGHLLPDAIRDELHWVYSMKLVCIRSRLVCVVRRFDGDRVTRLLTALVFDAISAYVTGTTATGRRSCWIC